MSDYYVDFENKTDRTWTMVVYQQLPESIGLESVAWKKTTAPRGGFTGVEWELDYIVSLANYKQDGGIGVYKASQELETALGKKWTIVDKDGVQQLEETGKAKDGYIEIVNKSKQLANPGVGMSDSPAVYKRKTLGGSTAQFQVTPTYYVGLFNNVELGTVISSNVIVGPLKIQFPSGMNKGVLTAVLDGESIKLDLTYKQSFVANHEQVLAML
ncbi:MAG: hypothetical protein WA919_16530 [Coleofasciculaceae cyanobacterium]